MYTYRQESRDVDFPRAALRGGKLTANARAPSAAVYTTWSSRTGRVSQLNPSAEIAAGRG
jgi:hypothetical protein